MFLVYVYVGVYVLTLSLYLIFHIPNHEKRNRGYAVYRANNQAALNICKDNTWCSILVRKMAQPSVAKDCSKEIKKEKEINRYMEANNVKNQRDRSYQLCR